jgi:serine/threonine-protein phosphatase 6 regulatory ankyrin repeat subunit B
MPKPGKPKPDEALIQAAAKGDLKTVQERIAAGADVNAAARKNAPAIFSAVDSGKVEVVQALIAAGADVNCIALPGGMGLVTSPLCRAIEYNQQEIAQCLIKAGADIALEIRADQNAAGTAADHACKSYTKYVTEEEAWLGKVKPGDNAALAKKNCDHWMQFIREAVSRGIKVHGYSLWDAVNRDFNELALLLLSAGVNPDTGPHGTTVLTRAVEHGNDEMIFALLKAGARANPPSGPASLLAAAKHGRISVVPALLDAGADINVTGDIQIYEYGENPNPMAEAGTALIIATRLGNAPLVKLLAERGADLNLGDKQGLTALSWATRLENKDIAEILRKSGAA